jgi:hypothetical protein
MLLSAVFFAGNPREPESTARSLSDSFSRMRHNSTTSSREEGKPPKKIRRKKKAKNPGSPGSTSSSSVCLTKSKTKSKTSNFRSCGAHAEDACVVSNLYQTSCPHEIV